MGILPGADKGLKRSKDGKPTLIWSRRGERDYPAYASGPAVIEPAVARRPGARMRPVGAADLMSGPQALALTDGQVRGQPVHAILRGGPPAVGGLGDIDDHLAALNPADRLGERRDAGCKTNGLPGTLPG